MHLLNGVTSGQPTFCHPLEGRGNLRGEENLKTIQADCIVSPSVYRRTVMARLN